MMKTTEPCVADYVCSGPGLVLNCTSVRGILLQRIMNPILIVVSHVFAKESAQMSLVQWDDTVQQLSATTSYPSLRYSVLPG